MRFGVCALQGACAAAPVLKLFNQISRLEGIRMKIEYKDADGRVMELDVSDEIGQFYLSSVEEAEKSDRRN